MWNAKSDINYLHFNLVSVDTESNVFEMGDSMRIKTYKSEIMLLYSIKFDYRYALGHVEKYVTEDKETHKVKSVSYAYIVYQINRSIISFKEELSDFILFRVINIPRFNDHEYLKENYLNFLIEASEISSAEILSIEGTCAVYDNKHIKNIKNYVESLYNLHNFEVNKDLVIEYLNQYDNDKENNE